METGQYGNLKEIEQFPRLRSAWQTGGELCEFVKAFATASVGVDSEILKPVYAEMATTGKARAPMAKQGKRLAENQIKMDVEAP